MPVRRRNLASAYNRWRFRNIIETKVDSGRLPGEECLKAARPLVSVVDDDESVRESLPDLLRELGFETEAFSSAEEFLDSAPDGRTECLILDVSMPGMTGPELQRELARRGTKIPIIFITAHADDTVRPTLIQQGAVACLFKPFGETELHDALRTAVSAS